MIKKIVSLAIVVMALMACQDRSGSRTEAAAEKTPAVISTENLVTISFDVEGMTCAGCEGAVVSSLKNIEGVAEAKASHQTGKTEVVFDKTLVTEESMENAISSRGYKVAGHSHSE